MKAPIRTRDSQFLISIVRVDGGHVFLKPGSQEFHDIVEAVVAATLKRRVGFWTSKPWVGDAVRDAIHEVLLSVTSRVRP